MQDHAFVNSGVSANSAGLGQSYYTRDLITEVPTIIQIVPVSSEALAMQRGLTRQNSDMLQISIDDVEPTAGWLSDRNNASLDICFMHSFGKCYGKVREKDPRTCHQLHVKREVLDNLRKYYTNPQRNYFCRTMKANVTETFAQVLSLLARRRINLQYLELRTEDIEVTAGSTEYEVQYRVWLISDTSTQCHYRAKAANILTDNFISSSNLCWDFALTGRCGRGASCPDLHGHVAKALTKDRLVKAALSEMWKKDCSAPSMESTQPGRIAKVCQPSPSAHQQQLPPPPLSTPQPCAPYMLSSRGAPPYCFLSFPPPPEMSALMQKPTLAAFSVNIPPLQGTPCFLVSEGSGNFFRLITQSQLVPFGSDTS